MCSYRRKVYVCGHQGRSTRTWCLHMQSRNRGLLFEEFPRYDCRRRTRHPDTLSRLRCRRCHREWKRDQLDRWDRAWDVIRYQAYQRSGWTGGVAERMADLRRALTQDFETEAEVLKEETEAGRDDVYREFPAWVERTLEDVRRQLGLSGRRHRH